MKKIKKYLLLLTLVVLPFFAFTQDPNPDELPPAPPECPGGNYYVGGIEDGLYFLIALGMMYALLKIYQIRKKTGEVEKV